MNGVLIKEIRLVLGITQLELGRQMGVDRRTIQRWERGETEINGPAEVLMNQLKTEAFRASGVPDTRLKKEARRKRKKWPKRG